MSKLRSWCWIGCMTALLCGAPSVRAADGRITFSGAIVEATCAFGALDLAALAGKVGAAPIHPHCDPRQTGAGRAGPGYRLEIADLKAAPGDPLLSYFAGYARGDGTGPRVVTQTFD